MRRLVNFTVALACASVARADSKVCAECHAKVWQSYQRTGMARSFSRPGPANTIEDSESRNFYDHSASGIRYEMIHTRDASGDHYFERQSAAKADPFDIPIDFVMGSGDHARTYLHRTARGTLQQLPVSWYAENGGEWAMSPGYDRPDHQGFQRAVTYDCMFCHNAYPEIPSGGGPRSEPAFLKIPEGIDCQRCHGEGEKHVALAHAGARIEQIRGAILNPSRLSPERQLEVCAQCHLETTSSPLPGSIVRYERGPFSYRPGEPLDDFMLHFDHAPGTGHDGKFEISSSVYRLRQSECFRKSNGALTCITCHNPHDAPRAEEAAMHYASVCRQCHGAELDRLVSAGSHTQSGDCIGCHMPKRRTEDVVHVAMTDHLIQRVKPAGDALAARAENPVDAHAYRGEVVRYDLAGSARPEDELYVAVAQVTEQSNLAAGIGRLQAAIGKYRPSNVEYELQLADALATAGRLSEALPVYREALKRDPKSAAALERLALCLSQTGRPKDAESALRQALEIAPGAARWVLLGGVRAQQGKLKDALDAFGNAMKLDPEMPDAFAVAGAVAFELGDAPRAEALLRRALALHPNHPAANNNFGNLLAASNRLEEAAFQFEAALRIRPDYAGARYDYALVLVRLRRFDQARAQLESILRSSSASPADAAVREEARKLIGVLKSQ